MSSATPSPDFGSFCYIPQNMAYEFSEEELAILETVNRKVGDAESLESIVDFLFESTQTVCPCDRLGLALLEEDGSHLVAKYIRANYSPLHLRVGYAEDIHNGSLQQVVENGQPRIINDLVYYFRKHPHSESTQLMLKEGAMSSMACPLVAEGRAVGMLFRSSRLPYTYDVHQLNLHLAIASHLSQAVGKAWQIEQLKAAKQSFNEMLGFVSHEIKNPLTVVMNDLWTLEKGLLGEMSEKQTAVVQRMHFQTEYITGLIREYLDLARLDDDMLQLSLRNDLNLAQEVIEPVAEMYLPQAKKKGLNLSICPSQEPVILKCDPDLLRIAMSNLIGNAVKYSKPDGMIRIRWEQKLKYVWLSVYNEGVGFPPHQRSKLFRRFSRLNTPELLQVPGTGLGLYNTWRIVQLHQGKISADSEEGRWAEFSVILPLDPTLSIQKEKVVEPGMEHVVMTVESKNKTAVTANPIEANVPTSPTTEEPKVTAVVPADTLRNMTAPVERNDQASIMPPPKPTVPPTASSLPMPPPPLPPIAMPSEVPSLEPVMEISGEWLPDTPISAEEIVQSGDEADALGTIEVCSENDVFADGDAAMKRVIKNLAAVDRNVHEVIEAKAVDRSSPGEAGDAMKHAAPRVLCIDDDPDISECIAHCLRAYGVDVFRAFNGMQGYWTGLDCHPDIIITDLKMPDGEGTYIFSRFKSHPLTENIPIIVLTGQAHPALKRQMIALGAEAYLLKPIGMGALLGILRRFISIPEKPVHAPLHDESTLIGGLAKETV